MLVYQRVNPSKPNGSHICPHTEAHGTVMEKNILLQERHASELEKFLFSTAIDIETW